MAIRNMTRNAYICGDKRPRMEHSNIHAAPVMGILLTAFTWLMNLATNFDYIAEPFLHLVQILAALGAIFSFALSLSPRLKEWVQKKLKL